MAESGLRVKCRHSHSHRQVYCVRFVTAYHLTAQQILPHTQRQEHVWAPASRFHTTKDKLRASTEAY